ncbi:MAG: DUF4340 domain-containing protein [Calditrichaeota bacterium]|nr:DUF4340 domain-containing protein [Calditrichota bacterium]
MKTKNTLILLVILIAISAYVYFYEIKGGEERKKEKEAAAELLPIKKDDVSEVILERPADHVRIHAKKTDDQWKIIEPIETEGDKFAIEGLINSVLNSKVNRVVAHDTSSLQDFGLKPPEGIIILSTKSGQHDTIFVGSKNPTGSFLFIRKNHQPEVELTSTSMSYEVKRNLFDFRDKTVLKFEKENVDKLDLKVPKGHYIVEKTGESWMITSPVRKKADKAEIGKLLNKVKNARVRKFVVEKAPSLAKYGLSHPKYVFTVFLKPNQSRKTLLIGKKEDKETVYAKDDSRNPIMSIPKSVPDGLNVSLFDLRDKTILHFKRENLSKIELIYPDSTIICQKDTSGNWMITFPDSAKTKSWKMSSLLSSLKNLKAKEFPGEGKRLFARTGLKKPQLIVRLYDKDGKFVESLLIGKTYDSKKTYVTTKEKKEVFGVSTNDLKNIKVRLEDIKAD